MPPIVLATDGSDYARAAASRAIDLAADRDATLHVVSIVDNQRFDEPGLSTAELGTIYAEDDAALSIEAVRELAADRDVSVEGHTSHGIPHEEILAYADAIDADTIVMGEHGDHDHHCSGEGRKVAERADCEVIVVRPVPA